MWTIYGNTENNKGPVPLITTLSTCLSKVVSEGFREPFKVTTRGLYATSRSRYYRPEQVQIISSHRFEGGEEKGDNTMMYVLETSDGLKGTLVNANAYSDGMVIRFISEVEDIRRKTSRHDSRNIC